VLNEIDLSRTDLNLLVLFDTVMRERHVGRAAESLNLSASAVSHGLGRLRRMLNDPLFLRTPKGVVPTERAVTLEPAITDVLARVRAVVESAGPFDPAQSKRRFSVGAPDGVSAVFLVRLFELVRQAAPGVDVGVRQLLPVAGERSPERAWRTAFDDLESRALDVAVLPSEHVPPRFARHVVYEERFMLAVRAGHGFKRRPTLDAYCSAEHLVVSLTGDPFGFVDEVLARSGRSRRVALTVPNFMFALAVIAQTELLCALPTRFAAAYGARFGVEVVEPPLPLGDFRLNRIATEAAMRDTGVAWFAEQVATACALPRAAPRAAAGKERPARRK
jgi:DNA-binding transcriptional LysR family regulator